MIKKLSILLPLVYLPLLMHHLQPADRSIHRPPDPHAARLCARWLNDTHEHTLTGYDFEENTIFKLFDYDHVMSNLLPTEPIPLRTNPSHLVHGGLLNQYIFECMREMEKAKKSKKKFKHFKILKKNNFDFKRSSGLIIFRPTQYPYSQFVIKLFSETPYRFVRPFKKDLEQNCLFRMGCGISRYLVGFTRIKNLKYMQKRMRQNAYWSTLIDTPRKWFWIPPNCRWFEVTGYGIGRKEKQSTILPSVYAIVSDAIEAERKLSIYNEKDKAQVLSLARWLDERLDPNIANYMIEKGTGKLVFVDTEHFPTNLGMRKRLGYTSYFSWHLSMIKKYFKDNFSRTKRERIAIRDGAQTPIMQCSEEL